MKEIKKALFTLACAVVMVITTVTPSTTKAAEIGTIQSKEISTTKDVFYAGMVYKHYYVRNTSTGEKMSIDSIKSSNTGVATVKLTGDDEFSITTKKAGTTTLTASKNGTKVLEAPLTVKSVYTFSTKYPKVKVGKSTDVKVSLATSATVKASSSDTSVCKVSVSSSSSYYATLKIKGIKAGTAKVTVKNTTTGEKATLKVTVSKPTVMSVSSKSVDVKKGSSATVKATLTKAGTIKASSANTGICTVKVNKVDSKHAKLVLTGKKVGKTTITVKNSVNKESIKITVNVKSKVDKTTRRAVIIAQRYEGSNNELTACEKDGIAMKKMLKQTGYSTVTLIADASASKIQNTIKNTFKDATSDDVSLVYYTGHGTSNGSLCCFNGSTINEVIAPETMAGWLKKVPGKVVFISDSCYSGAFIDKSANAEYADKQIVKAFAENDVMLKSGPMSSSKFEVITASNKYQTSACNNSYSYFTKYLVDGVGFGYFNGDKLSKAPADKDNDKNLTTNECYKYTYNQCLNSVTQRPQVYPTNSSFTMFKR